MDNNLKFLQEITPILAKVVDGYNLSADESEKLFTTIFLYDTEGYHLATLIGAIHAKGETADELLGFVNSYRKLGVQIKSTQTNKAVDLSGTGGGSFKTINVSTTSSFVVAAAGYPVCKQTFFGVTSPIGSADVFLAFGIDILKITKETLKNTILEVGICPFFTPAMSPKLANMDKIDRKFFVERQVRVRSPYHIAANIYCPISLKFRIYGCYSEKYLGTLAELFMKLGFKRSLTFYAQIGIPEISNVGETVVVEQNGKKLKQYKVKPQDLGVKEAKPEDIQTGGKEQNIKDFVRILRGKETGPKADLVAVNAGAALYILGDQESLKRGVEKAKRILRKGTAFDILEKLVKKLGSPDNLEEWLKKAIKS